MNTRQTQNVDVQAIRDVITELKFQSNHHISLTLADKLARAIDGGKIHEIRYLPFTDEVIDKMQNVLAVHGFTVPVSAISDAFRTTLQVHGKAVTKHEHVNAIPECVVELLNHLEDVLSDEEFERIDTEKWNNVTNMYLQELFHKPSHDD